MGGMQPCTTTDVYDTVAFGQNVALETVAAQPRRVWGRVAPNGEELHFFVRDTNNSAILGCFNLRTRTNCWGPVDADDVGRQFRSSGFQNFDGDGNYIGICAYSNRTNTDTAFCVNPSGTVINSPNGIATTIGQLENGWIGESFVWTNPDGQVERLFIGGGRSDRIVCYNFDIGAPCTEAPNGTIDAVDIAPQWAIDANVGQTGANAGLLEPYAFVSVTAECLLGLGDESIFFSLSPRNLTTCTDTITSTVIEPCLCTGTGIPNWAAIQLPQSLLDSVTKLDATARDATPGSGAQFDASGDYIKGSGPIVGGIFEIDVFTTGTNGFVDLSPVPDSVSAIELVLGVESAINNVTNAPEFDSPAMFNLTVISQPTLTN